MTWRLVLGVVYMQRRSLLSLMVMMAFFSRIALGKWHVGGAMMLLAAGAGMTAQSALATRALTVLPIGPRQMHQAVWALSALLPLAMLTAGRCVSGVLDAIWSDGWTFRASAVQVFFEVVYFSVAAGWAVQTPERYEPAYDQEPHLIRYLLTMGAFFLVVPFAVLAWLPPSPSEVPVLVWVSAAVLFGVGLRPLIWPPSVYQHPPVTTIAPEPPLPAHLRPPATTDFASRFEGMWVPMRGVAAQALTGTVVMLVFLAVVQRLTGVITLWWPFDASMTDLRFLTTICLPMMFLIALCPSLAPWIGVLKRLPLSSRRLALLQSVAPTTMPLMFWTALLILHLLAAAEAPNALRLGLLMMFIGIVALIDALGTKTGSGTAKSALGFFVFAPLVFGLDTNRALVEAMLAHWALPLVGVLCLVLAWVVNFHTLTRSPGSARAFHLNRRTDRVGAR